MPRLNCRISPQWLIALELALDYSSYREEANHSCAILENQPGSLRIHHGSNQMAVRLGNAPTSRGLIVACEFAFFHSGHADEANYAFAVFKNESGTDLVWYHRGQTPIRFRHSAFGRRVSLCGGSVPVSHQVAGHCQQATAQNTHQSSSHKWNLSVK